MNINVNIWGFLFEHFKITCPATIDTSDWQPLGDLVLTFSLFFW